MPSRELWLYNHLNKSWTQLEDAVSVCVCMGRREGVCYVGIKCDCF